MKNYIKNTNYILYMGSQKMHSPKQNSVLGNTILKAHIINVI